MGPLLAPLTGTSSEPGTIMDGQRIIDLFPLWAVFILMVGSILSAVQAGYWIGTREKTHIEAGAKASAGETVGAALGLVALMLAFTFNMAATRHDNRRTLIITEANAIGTTYLRAGLLAEPQRSKVRNLLREYVEVRLKAVRDNDIAKGHARSLELHEQLWKEAETAGTANPGSIVVGLFIQTLNEVIDLHSRRIALGWRSRIPIAILGGLYLVSLAGFGSLGYQVGLSSGRKTTAALLMAVGFSIVMLLIADLDRPQQGMLTVSQRALVDVLDSMKPTAP